MSTAPLRVMIVDDEQLARQRLKDLLSECRCPGPPEVVAEAANGRLALEMVSAAKPDVVLLDIRMPELDGIEVARHLRVLPEPPAVIFTTAYDAYAVQAFEVHAIDYLLKPIRLSRLEQALARARGAGAPDSGVLQAIQQTARAFLSAHERGRIHLIPVEDIVYLRAELKYVTARTRQKEYVLDESLNRLEQEYASRFVRVHRSCMVARDAITGFERVSDEGEGHWVVVLDGCSERLPVSRRQQHIVREFGRG